MYATHVISLYTVIRCRKATRVFIEAEDETKCFVAAVFQLGDIISRDLTCNLRDPSNDNDNHYHS